MKQLFTTVKRVNRDLRQCCQVVATKERPATIAATGRGTTVNVASRSVSGLSNLGYDESSTTLCVFHRCHTESSGGDEI